MIKLGTPQYGKDLIAFWGMGEPSLLLSLKNLSTLLALIMIMLLLFYLCSLLLIAILSLFF